MISKIFRSGKVITASRLILGVLFIAAGISKLQNPEAFTTLVTTYHLLPYSLGLAYGYLVPWVELMTGVFLLLGVFIRFASVISILLTLSFIIASSYRIATGSVEDCGCFGDILSLTLYQSLGFDAIMLVLAAPLLARRPVTGPEKRLPGSFFIRDHSWYVLARSIAPVIIAGLVVALSALVYRPAEAGNSGLTSFHQPPQTETAPVLQLPEETPVVSIEEPAAPGETGDDLDETIVRSLEAGKPVFLEFYAVWCGTCQEESPIIDALEMEYESKITFIRIDVDENRRAMEEFNVDMFPTMMMITDVSAKSQFSRRIFIGYTAEGELRQLFEEVLSAFESGNS